MIEFLAAEVVARTASADVRVLQPTTLQLSEQRVALIGPNGSGKSTLAKLCNGLIEPTSGLVRVQAPSTHPSPTQSSHSPHTPSPHAQATWLDTVRDGPAVRRTVGFVFTHPAAQLVMPTVIEDLALSLRRVHKNKKHRLEAAHRTLKQFGLDELADRSVHSLSGGQQQLLAMAGVLATDPAILVADEPTTLLDLTNSRTIIELLLSLPQQVIVATHDLELAAACDRALVVMNGAVAFDSAAEHATAADAVTWYRSRA